MMPSPSSSGELDPLTTRTLDRMVRDHPWTGDWRRVRERADRSRRVHRGMPLLISAVAGAFLVILVIVLSVRTDTRTAADHRWSDPVNGISIDVEAPFQRASLALAPASHEILSLSTGPLLIGSPTDRLPTDALAAIGDRGVFITLHELEPPEDLVSTGEATHDIGYQQRPASFILSKRTESDSTVVPGYGPLGPRVPGTRRWVIPFTDHGRRLIAIVVAGADVAQTGLDQASRLLDSLQVSPRPVGDPIPRELRNGTSPGRARYIGTTDGRRAYVGIAKDGSMCILIQSLSLSCSGREIASKDGVVAIDRSAAGEWFGVIVPPSTGNVTVNDAVVGDGPQPILFSGVKSDPLLIRQNNITLAHIPSPPSTPVSAP